MKENILKPKKGAAVKAFAAVLLSVGALNSMLEIKSGIAPGALGCALLITGAALFLGAARSSGAEKRE